MRKATELEKFLEQITICCLEDETRRHSVFASGIKLPENLANHLFTLEELELKNVSEDPSGLPADMRILLSRKDKTFSLPRSPSIIAKLYNAIKRRDDLIKSAIEIVTSEVDPDDVIKRFESRPVEPVESGSLDDLANYFLKEIKFDADSGTVKTIVPGFELLSDAIGGFNTKRISILTGASGLGKTNWAINFSLGAAKIGAVAYVNMEMGYRDMVARFAVIQASSYQSFFNGRFNPEEIANELKRPFHISLTSGRQLNLEQIKSHLALEKQTHDIKFAIIDYDQKIDLQYDKNTPEWKELQKTLVSLETLSMDLELHIVVLAQVNREGNISGSYRSIFPAHTVLAFLEHEIEGTIIHAKKNRHGKKDIAVKVRYSDDSSRITEIELISLNPRAAETRERKEHYVKNSRRQLPDD